MDVLVAVQCGHQSVLAWTIVSSSAKPSAERFGGPQGIGGLIRSPGTTDGLSLLKESPAMSEQRSAKTRIVGSSSAPRRRRWVIGVVAALGASGLILGGVGVPVSADDVSAGGNPHASVTVQDSCVTAAAGMGEAGGSVYPQGDGTQIQASGDGTATVSVCRDDLADPDPGDPGGSVPGEIDDIVPGDPGSLTGELVGAVTGELDGALPGDGEDPLPGDPTDGLAGGLDDVAPGDLGDIIPGGPGGDLPGDLGDVAPGGLGGLVPDDSGVDAGGLIDRLAQIIPGAIDDGGTPGGNGGGQPAVNVSATGSGSGSVVVGSEGAGRGAPIDVVHGAELEPGTPALVGVAVSPGTALPRTGGGLGSGVLRLIALLGFGRAIIGLANRRRFAADVDRT